MWVGLDKDKDNDNDDDDTDDTNDTDDEIVLASLPKRIKVTNVERDPRVSLSIQSPTRNERGLDEYLVIHGHARVTEGGGPELLQRLAHTYIGPDAVFPAPGSPPGYLTHVTIDKISGVGNWTD